MPLTPNRQINVFDMDGVFVNDSDEEVRKANSTAAAHAALMLARRRKADFTIKQLQQLDVSLYKNTGNNLGLAEVLGIPETLLHHATHALMTTAPLKIVPCEQMRCLLEHSSMDASILTHANHAWTERQLQELGIAHLFPKNKRVCLEDVNYQRKSNTPAPFMEVLTRTGHQPHQAVMIEDSQRNLLHAKKLGMATVLITHGRTPDLADHVDAAFNTVADFLQAQQNTLAA